MAETDEQAPSQEPQAPETPDAAGAPTESPDSPTSPEPHEPRRHSAAWRTSPPMLLGVLAVIGVLVLVALILILFRAAGEGESLAGHPSNVEEMLPGVWVADDSGTRLQITFSPHGEYEFTGFRGAYDTVGDWSVTEENLVEVPVHWRNYDSVWYFEPVTATKLHLEVDELEWDLTFEKVP